MGNRENTAVNELIARASGGPSSPSPQRSPHTAYPATMPVAAPFEPQRAELPTSYPVVPRALLAAVTPLAPDPVAPVETPIEAAATPFRPAPSGGHATLPVALPVANDHEQNLGTLQLRRPSDLRVVIGKLVLPVALLVITGVLIGGYVALRGSDRPETPSPAARAAEAPAAPVAPPAPPPAELPAVASAVTPAQPAAGPPALVDVRIDSTPSGATVTLVDRGRSQFVGNTPVNVAVDPSREYDLMFSYPNKPVQVEHLDASATRRVAVTLGQRAPARPPDVAPRRAERAGEGTLMISSKPPCEIVIDGKPTGLTTPQRSIQLSAGAHNVTLVNSEKDIKKTINVQITANATEKVIEDLMK